MWPCAASCAARCSTSHPFCGRQSLSRKMSKSPCAASIPRLRAVLASTGWPISINRPAAADPNRPGLSLPTTRISSCSRNPSCAAIASTTRSIVGEFKLGMMILVESPSLEANLHLFPVSRYLTKSIIAQIASIFDFKSGYSTIDFRSAQFSIANQSFRAPQFCYNVKTLSVNEVINRGGHV